MTCSLARPQRLCGRPWRSAVGWVRRRAASSLILHTWNQRLLFHPHLHAIVPGAGLDAKGRVVTVKNAGFLVPQRVLRQRFAKAFQERWEQFAQADLPAVEAAVWRRAWGVHLQSFGNGENAIKYLGAYVCRTAIGDRRIVSVSDSDVTFTWQDRAHGGVKKPETLSGVEFVGRYLRHVLPAGLKAVRHYGYCHPAAKAKRQRIAFHTGRPLVIAEEPGPACERTFRCSCCGAALRRTGIRLPAWRTDRAPPANQAAGRTP
jgi:hypothetical protein